MKRYVIFAIAAVALIAAGVLPPVWRLGGPGAQSVNDYGPVSNFFLDSLVFYGGLLMAATFLISVFTVPKPGAVWIGVIGCLMALVFSVACIMAAEQLSTDDAARSIGPGPFLYVAGAVAGFIACVLAIRNSTTVYPD